MSSSIRTCLWFHDGRGHEAATFYCALVPGSRIESTFRGDAGHGTMIDVRSLAYIRTITESLAAWAVR